MCRPWDKDRYFSPDVKAVSSLLAQGKVRNGKNVPVSRLFEGLEMDDSKKGEWKRGEGDRRKRGGREGARMEERGGRNHVLHCIISGANELP